MASVPLNHLLKIGAEALQTTAQTLSAAINELKSDKQDNLTFDNAPTQGSDNPVKSSGIYTALLGKVTGRLFGTEVSADGVHVTFSGIDNSKGYILEATLPDNYDNEAVSIDNIAITNDGATPPVYSVTYTLVNATVNQSFDLIELG